MEVGTASNKHLITQHLPLYLVHTNAQDRLKESTSLGFSRLLSGLKVLVRDVMSFLICIYDIRWVFYMIGFIDTVDTE